MGKEAKDILQKLEPGDKGALERVKKNIKVSDKYKSKNFDLITWFIVSYTANGVNFRINSHITNVNNS